MKKIISFASAMLLMVNFAQSKVLTSRYSIDFSEALTQENIDNALKEFAGKQGTVNRATLKLKGCTNEDLALAMQKMGDFGTLEIRDSPKLTSLDPIKGKNFTSLSLYKLPGVNDISAIGELSKLSKLSIDDVPFQAPDLSFLEKLSGISSITLAKTPNTFKSVKGLEKSLGLRSFKISKNGAPVDLSPISVCPQITSLDLSFSQAMDLTCLKLFPNLNDVSFYAATDLDFEPLVECKKLKKVFLFCAQRVKDFSVLGKIKTLEDIQAGDTKLEDISWMAELPALKNIRLAGESIKSYEPLARCKALESLMIWQMRNEIDLATFIGGLENSKLKVLSLDSSAIKNEAKFTELAKTKIEVLSLNNVKTSAPLDLTFVASLSTLKTLWINNLNVTNYSSIGKCVSLQILYSACKGVDCSVLKDLPNLKILSLPGSLKTDEKNPFKDIKNSSKLTVYYSKLKE